MAERSGALLATLLLVVGTGATPSHRLSDVVLIIGWGHLLGALLGDARRLKRAGFRSILPGGVTALALACFAACVAAGTVLLGSPVVQLLLLGCVFAHVFENEATRRHVAGGFEAAGIAAPTLGIAVLALRSLTPSEAAALEPWMTASGSGALIALGCLALAFVALASHETRGRGVVALGLLAAAATSLPGMLSGVDVVAATAAYHFIRFGLRMSQTPAGVGRVLAVHAAPVAVVAMGSILSPLAEVSRALLQPGLFLLGSFVHSLHTAWPSPATAPFRTSP